MFLHFNVFTPPPHLISSLEVPFSQDSRIGTELHYDLNGRRISFIGGAILIISLLQLFTFMASWFFYRLGESYKLDVAPSSHKAI